MSTHSFQISNLLEKMCSSDKDYRFMATNDLMIELENNIALDDDTERKVVKTLLRLLEDKNGEVQNLAVRCLAPLMHKIKIEQFDTLVNTLCANMESNDTQLCDVSSIALKVIMHELRNGPSEESVLFIKFVLPRLIKGLRTDNTKAEISVKLEMLDLLSNIILRFGRVYVLQFNEIEKAIFIQLEKERQALRKRAIHALSNLVEVVKNESYDNIVDRILKECKNNLKNAYNLRTYVSAATAICRTSSARFAYFLPEFVPLLDKFCNEIDDDELKEACLQAFECFTYRCAKEVKPFLNIIIENVSKLITYDPNYQYDDLDDKNGLILNDEMEIDENKITEEEIEDQDEYSDDDDLSWKVRRASAKCIETLISYHSNRLFQNCSVFGPLLIKRFKEREDNVKYDIFQSYSALLKQTIRFFPDSFENRQNSLNTIVIETDGISLKLFEKFMNEEFSEDQSKIFNILRSQAPSFVKAVFNEMKAKNLRTRQQCFILLSNFLKALPNSLSNHLHLFIPLVQSVLNEKSADGSMKIHALHFVLVVLNTHHVKTIYSLASQLTNIIVNGIQDTFYKISSEALVVAQLFINILRPVKNKDTLDNFDYSIYVEQLYNSIVAKLKITDIDQEVKEKTILAMGFLISVFGDQTSVKLNECVPLLLDRLRNEVTRCVTVKAFNAIAKSSLKIDLTPYLSELLQCLAEFLRKNYRTLRILSLILMESLVIRYSQGGLENSGLLNLVRSIPNLITEQDLQISLLAIKFITDVINAYPDQISDTLTDLFMSLIRLTQSSLLHGATLAAVLKLFVAIVKSPLPNKPTFEYFMEHLSIAAYECKTHVLHKQAYIGMAKAIAAVTKAYGDLSQAKKLILQLKEPLSNTNKITNDSVTLFALTTFGELGRIYYEAFDAAKIEPEKWIINCFNNFFEDIKAAASYSLGTLTLGNMEKFLPFLLQQINDNPKKQYQLLQALKEVITNESIEELATEKFELYEIFLSAIPAIWNVLVQHCDCNEEGIRSIVAECLGKLCLVDTNNLLQHLLSLIENKSPRVRRTAVNAVRFMIVDNPLLVDEVLRPTMEKFLKTITDSDLQVRRSAIITLNSAAHNKPKLIRDCLHTLLPHLYSETMVKKDLVREVEMGPFKHIVDDGLDLRKAAFECMYTLAEQFLDKIDIFEYMNNVENGLSDQHDIKLLTFLMIIRLTIKCPLQVIQRTDRLCELIKPQMLLRPKQNAVKQENEKQEEVKRSAVRAFLAIKKIPNQEITPKMMEIIELIHNTPELNFMLNVLERESIHHNTEFAMDVVEI